MRQHFAVQHSPAGSGETEATLAKTLPIQTEFGTVESTLLNPQSICTGGAKFSGERTHHLMASDSPILNSVRCRIVELETMDLRIVDDSSIYARILDLLSLAGARPIGIDTSNHVFRIRRNPAERLHSSRKLDWYPPLFTTVEQLWYPPPESVHLRGRVNFSNQSIFYCAESLETAVLEMRPQGGEYLTLLECAFVDGAVAHIFDAGVFEGPGKLNPNYGGGEPDKDSQYQTFLTNHGLLETTQLIRPFLVKQFMRVVVRGNEHEYKITNAIAKVLLKEFVFERRNNLTPVDVAADGIAYASIAAEAKSPNVALTAEAADRLLRPVACRVYLVEGFSERGWPMVQKSHVCQAINPDGTIIWYRS